MTNLQGDLEELRSLVLDKDKNVRWEAIRDRYFDKVGDSLLPGRLWLGGDDDKVWRILHEEGIFSTDFDGNYLILAGGMVGNPSVSFGKFYFTREEDARAYTELKYRRALYEVSIIKCQKVEKGFDFTHPQ